MVAAVRAVTGWRDHAVCRGRDPEIWHTPSTVEQARSYCRRCPVRDLCLTVALAAGEGWGVWGGLTAAERHRVKPTVAERERLFVLTEIENGATTVRHIVDRLGLEIDVARRHIYNLERAGVVIVTRTEHHPLRLEVA